MVNMHSSEPFLNKIWVQLLIGEGNHYTIKSSLFVFAVASLYETSNAFHT